MQPCGICQCRCVLESGGNYKVLIGNQKWLELHAVATDERVEAVLSGEQQLGSIAVLCAVNGELCRSDRVLIGRSRWYSAVLSYSGVVLEALQVLGYSDEV